MREHDNNDSLKIATQSVCVTVYVVIVEKVIKVSRTDNRLINGRYIVQFGQSWCHAVDRTAILGYLSL